MARVAAPPGAGPTPSLVVNLSVCALLMVSLVAPVMNLCANLPSASGLYDGVSFIEILPEGRMLHLGFL